MKWSWILWWIVTAFWIMIFTASTISVWTRNVDGADITQTYDTKLATFIVLLVAFIVPLILQIIWMMINIIVHKNKISRKHVDQSFYHE
ncbi:DUF3923 family protein [Staphylococcus felis]|uniref:DUF3923 family protein n=1 Tax=Staphylococcus felis TaxID=46127 RepID=UPI003966BDEC